MNKEEIRIPFGRVQVLVQTKNMGDWNAGVVEIPELGLTINGAACWGTDSTRPRLVDIFRNAYTALVGHYHEYIKGPEENYTVAAELIENTVKHYVMPHNSMFRMLADNPVTGMVRVNGEEYTYSRSVTLVPDHSLSSLYPKKLIVSSFVEWGLHGSDTQWSVRKTGSMASIAEYVNRRDTNQLVADLIRQHTSKK